ncbi:MAG: TrkA family potassium uptake protein [Lachnospiraceae bacterium]|jgi:trk system potassium uptake protein TrkA|nr:TrkA family potassium uptake protein [Lachnospiraceae bacterium]
MNQKHGTKSILVIGMGRFGRYLAKKMEELGNSVMVVDSREGLEADLSSLFNDYLIGGCTNKNVLKGLGVGNFDICFVTIGENFEASIVITSLLKSLGAKHIVTKASRDIQATVLRKVGADEIVYPEKEMAEKLAVRYNMRHVFDYIELTGDYAIFEIAASPTWVGKTVGNLNIRQKYKVNILAVKSTDEVHPAPGADYVFRPEDVIFVIGREKDVAYLTSLG